MTPTNLGTRVALEGRVKHLEEKGKRSQVRPSVDESKS